MTSLDPQFDLSPVSIEIDRRRLEVPHSAAFICEFTPTAAQQGRAIPHVANTEFVRWLDRAAELHADSLGYARAWMERTGLMWFVARHEIDYCAEVWPNDRLLIATWVRDLRRVKSWRDYVIWRPADDVIVCRAATLWVLVDLETRRPTRVPEEMATAFAPVEPIRL